MQAFITPFLMFQGGRAEEALNFYCGTIPDSRIVNVESYGPGEPGKEGSFKLARASIGGLEVMVFESPVEHAFTFTPSFSLFVTCRSEQEFEAMISALRTGEFLMPPGNYGFSRRFAWLNDRFGVSWQINLP